MRFPLPVLSCCAVLAIAGSAAVAQTKIAGLEALLPTRGSGVHADRLSVKIVDDADVVLDGRVLKSRNGSDLRSVQALFDRAVAVEPLVPDVPRALLDEWHAHAVATLRPQDRPGHLAHWFRLRCASVAAADELQDLLRADPRIVWCHREPIPVPASAGAPPQGNDPPPPTPSFVALQLSHGLAPSGMAINWANGILGGRGRGTKVRMVEEDWLVDHEDISKLTLTSFLGVLPQFGSFVDHGTAGASMIAADRNTWGLTGAADEVDLKCISYVTNTSMENSIAVAAADAQSGNVLTMVVMFLLGQAGPTDWVPFELFPSVFDAVRTTTANGRIVVASAANGAADLDAPRFLGLFDRNVRDSGAIFVGASDGPNPTRATFSNYGNLVDANGWGNSEVAAGYGTAFFGNNDRRQSYITTAGGTSSAVPVVAGAIAAVQGAARRQLGRDIGPAEMRTLVRTHGTAVAGNIGLRPDLRALFAATGIADGLEMQVADVLPGGSAPVTATDPAAAGALLFASFGTANLGVGLNRNVHLDLGSLVNLGFQLMAGGSTTWTIAVPPTLAVHGTSLYFQAATVRVAAPLHVTNSTQLTVL